MRFRLRVNGQAREADVPLGTTLLGVLRDDLGLTAARFGCGHGACGACYVLVDGRAVPACMTSVEESAGKNITTVEGLAKGGELHPVQRAFVEEDGMQCGYCISGMLISSAALLAETPHPSDAQIREALAPHLCRCGVYLRAMRAVRRAAQ
jgi:aerobic-type carbon monoxide dehydrogenase small subunit (CoxS/CutS family)